MKHLAFAFCLACSPSPAATDDLDFGELFNELQRLSEDLRPTLEHWAYELSPILEDLADKIDDITAYELPEVLPNGDIIIRRKRGIVRDLEPKNEIEL